MLMHARRIQKTAALVQVPRDKIVKDWCIFVGFSLRASLKSSHCRSGLVKKKNNIRYKDSRFISKRCQFSTQSHMVESPLLAISGSGDAKFIVSSIRRLVARSSRRTSSQWRDSSLDMLWFHDDKCGN